MKAGGAHPGQPSCSTILPPRLNWADATPIPANVCPLEWTARRHGLVRDLVFRGFRPSNGPVNRFTAIPRDAVPAARIQLPFPDTSVSAPAVYTLRGRGSPSLVAAFFRCGGRVQAI
jgi:hypothetical protein